MSTYYSRKNGVTKKISGLGSYTEGDGIDINGNEIKVDTVFNEAVTRTNIASGDSLSTIFGKIKKWFTDIPSIFVSKSGDTMTGQLTVNNSGAAVQIKAEKSHTSTTSQATDITIGNNTADGTAGSDYGRLALYGKGTNYTLIQATGSTSNRTIECPDADGTLALTSDLSSYVQKSGDTMTGALNITGVNVAMTIDAHNGTTSTVRGSRVDLGNNIAQGTDGNSRGVLRLYGKTSKYAEIYDDNGLTANRSLYLPDASGTLVLDSDINTHTLSISQYGAIAAYAITANSDISLTIPSFSKYEYTATATDSSRGYFTASAGSGKTIIGVVAVRGSNGKFAYVTGYEFNGNSYSVLAHTTGDCSGQKFILLYINQSVTW